MKPIAALLLLSALTLHAQANDSQTLAAILAEVRQLRQELASTTLAAQRAQVLLYRLQLQGETVKSAAQRHDQVLVKLREIERAHSDNVNGLKGVEEKLETLAAGPQRTDFEGAVREMKRRAEVLTREEAELRSVEITTDSELKREQSTLTELQQKLEQLERQMQNYPGTRVTQ